MLKRFSRVLTLFRRFDEIYHTLVDAMDRRRDNLPPKL